MQNTENSQISGSVLWIIGYYSQETLAKKV
jgi:hypothetical protein